MADEYGLVVRFQLRSGAAAEFDALVSETLEQIREREPGTLVYASHVVQDRPDERIFYELYRDEAAFMAHERQPHVRRFLAAREKYVDSFMVDRLHLTQAKGIRGQPEP